MPLLEIITHPGNDPEVVVSAVSYGRKLGKTVIVVRDGPGFYANRVLAPYVNTAGLLLDEGVSIEAVDEALVTFGFPVGPITLVDEVGLDVATKAGAIVAEAFGARMAPNESIQRVIRAGRLGRKGKRGFYQYDETGKKGGVDGSVYDLLPTGQKRTTETAARIVQRCVYAMLNEAVLCLEDGILRSPRDGDIGAVFGDTYPYEVMPPESGNWDDLLAVHMLQLRDMGLIQGQNWNFEVLAEAVATDGRAGCLLVAAPEPIVGATSAPVNPVAIR